MLVFSERPEPRARLADDSWVGWNVMTQAIDMYVKLSC
jgi:hypothetical protein